MVEARDARDGDAVARSRCALPAACRRAAAIHVIQRGNNRGACFFHDDDYTRYLAYLGELADKFECAVHAYCLMTNHVQLLLTSRRADGSALLMKYLGQRYVQHVNRAYARSGPLWEGRFRSCLLDAEPYLPQALKNVVCPLFHLRHGRTLADRAPLQTLHGLGRVTRDRSP